VSAAERLGRMPAGVWFLLALVAALAVVCWHRFCCDDQDTSWLDPQQPPLNVDVDKRATVAGVLLPAFRAPKPYPWNSLQEHPGCWVGDC